MMKISMVTTLVNLGQFLCIFICITKFQYLEFDDVGLDDDEDHKEVVSILPESLLEKNELDKSSVAPEVKPTVPKTAKIRGKKKKKAPAAKKKK